MIPKRLFNLSGNHLDPFIDRKKRSLPGIDGDPDNQIVHNTGRAIDNIHMPIGHWIKRAWARTCTWEAVSRNVPSPAEKGERLRRL